ncbi:MAG: hypothetical protein JXR25_11430 [Pontiellaceae bacterium]|nr:hypothetical protein [Pontiellaceae bacterium]MBN2785425.1 hypothetical protein [Pontiellaceae bacterium]
MNDEELRHLDLLAIFYYVVGGIVGLFSCMFVMHIFMGIGMLNGNFFGEEVSSGPPPIMGWMFVISGSVAVFGGWATAICMILAGRRLHQRRQRIFCMVVAGIECFFTPFGTVLGIFTLILLSKESVRQIFMARSGYIAG